MVRRLVAIAAILTFLASCGEPQEDLRDVRRAVSRAVASSHAMRYTETVGGRTVEVSFRVEDAFLSDAILTLDGVPLFEEKLIDDAIAVRLLAPDLWNPASGTPLAAILGSGKWVVDPAGAPPVLFTQTEGRDITDVGFDHIFDAANALEYVRAVAEQSRRVVRFNKDSIEYRPAEDPFRKLVDADDREDIVRYDAVPLILPRSAEQTGGRNEPPDSRYFRKLGIYVKDGRIVRILEVIDFERHEEIRKAKERGRPKFLLDMLVTLRRGVGDSPVRPRRMSIHILPAGEVGIAMPADALTANLGSLLESGALAKLPDPEQLKAKQQEQPAA
jgi:hypothetical protein